MLNVSIRRVLLACAAVLVPVWLHAATLTVCTTGCTYTPAQLQTAIDAAAPGDTILLENGLTFTGSYLLRQKACAAQNETCYITIRAGVSSTGTITPLSSFPAGSIRATPSTATNFAIFQPAGNNLPSIRTIEPAETGSGCAAPPCVAAWWRLQWLHFRANSYGGNALVILGSQNTSGTAVGGDTQNTAAEEPHHFMVDQCLFSGDPIRGQERAINFFARDVQFINNYVQDMKAQSDKSALWTDNTTGNLTIINNYIGGGTENFIAGGDIPRMNEDTTVSASPAPTSTVFAVATLRDYVFVGQGLSVVVGGVKRYTRITNISGTTLTVEALPAAPVAGAAVNYSVVPRNLTFHKNHLFKPTTWRDPIVPTPQSVTASASATGGTLVEGTYSYRVVARHPTAGGQTARSTASVEVSAAVETGVTTGSVTISWAAVTGATEYRVYGRSAGGQNVRWTVTAPTTTYTDTGAAGTTEAVPTSAGNTWMMKNLFELKKWHTASVEGNVMDYSWLSGQTGYAVLFTVLNNSTTTDGNDSAVVRNITFRYNHIRHAAAAIQLTGIPADGDIGDRTRDITIEHNIFEDIGTAWGNKENTIVITTGTNAGYTGTGLRGPMNVLINRNTILNSQGKSAIVFDLYKAGEQHECQNCDITNNMLRKVDFGLRNTGSAGIQTEGLVSWENATDAASTWANNVVQGASCSVYPGPPTPSSTYCPSETAFQSAFVGYSTGNFAVTGVWATASTTGGPVGADPSLITPLTNVALSGNNSGGTPPVSPTITTTSPLPLATSGSAYSTTFTATGGVPPYTWTLNTGSTLPTGLTLSTAGVLSGATTTSGTHTFTVRVTGADTGTSTAPYALTVQEVLTPSTRPDSVDYVEIAVFRRATAPDVADDVRVGDLWFDLSTGTLMKATATSPTITWQSIGGTATSMDAGGLISGTVPLARLGTDTPATNEFLSWDNTWRAPAGGSGVVHVLFFSSTGTTYTNAPSGGGEWNSGSNRWRQRLNLSGVTQCFIAGNVISPAVAGAELRVQYWDGAAWTNSGLALPIHTNGFYDSLAYVTIPAGMRIDGVSVRLFLSDGDAAADPSVSTMNMSCKP